jgi:Flp pilus assembly protein TadD
MLDHNQVVDAIEELEQLREKRPNSQEVRMRLVEAYYRQARISLDAGDQVAYADYMAKAEQELLVSVSKWPESFEPHNWYGIIRAYQGDLPASLESFRNALRLAKRRGLPYVPPNLYTNLAHIYVYQGKVGNARRYIDRGKKTGASPSEIERIELLAAWKTGDMVEARDIFEMATLTPGFVDTWDMAPLDKPMENLDDFAGVCCSNPSCGPHMANACKRMQQSVARRKLDDETIRKQLELEMNRRRELKKIYEKRKDLEIKVEDAP